MAAGQERECRERGRELLRMVSRFMTHTQEACLEGLRVCVYVGYAAGGRFDTTRLVYGANAGGF